jgi:hypothetical protein
MQRNIGKASEITTFGLMKKHLQGCHSLSVLADWQYDEVLIPSSHIPECNGSDYLGDGEKGRYRDFIFWRLAGTFEDFTCVSRPLWSSG